METIGKIITWPYRAAHNKATEARDDIRNAVLQQALIQMEVQKAVNIARTRDMLQWYGGLYTTVLSAVTAAKVAGRQVPGFVAVPLVIGGFQLCFMADMAYGTKMIRVRKEAENIIANEKGLLVPPRQTAFFDLYDKEILAEHASVGRVGSYWPWAAREN